MTDQQYDGLITVLSAINANLTALNARLDSLIEPVTRDEGDERQQMRVDVYGEVKVYGDVTAYDPR